MSEADGDPSHPLKRSIILGAPRSGTTWLGEIVNSHPLVAYRHQPMHAYSFPLKATVSATTQEIDEFFEALLLTNDPYVTNLRAAALGARAPEFMKDGPSHILFKETHFPLECARMIEATPDVKLIGIIRDPVGCISSWYGVKNEFDDNLDIRSEWRSAPSRNVGLRGEVFGFDGWFLTVSTILWAREKFPDRVEVVRYEDLVEAPRETVARVFQMLELDVGPQTQQFLRSTGEETDSSPYGVYRKRDEQTSRRELPPDIVAEIRRITREVGLGKFLAS